MVGAIRQKINARFGTVFSRRSAVQHADRNTLPLEPVFALIPVFASAATQGLHCLIQTFLKTVAAQHNIAGTTPDARNGVTRANHISPAQLDRMDPHFERCLQRLRTFSEEWRSFPFHRGAESV